MNDFLKQYGFAEGLKSIDIAKEAGRKVTETTDSFEWEEGFVKKDFIKQEEELTKKFFLNILTNGD